MSHTTIKSEQNLKSSIRKMNIRIPGFSPSKVLDFGAGTSSSFSALQEVWPKSLEKVNLIEPSQSMQRAGRSLIQGLKNLPLIHSYDNIQSLSKSISKSEREHDLVIAVSLFFQGSNQNFTFVYDSCIQILANFFFHTIFNL
ncbi:hypothetical protein JHK84_050414 [Glycine max]|uniref:Methyltransferase type 11 domain-containing protein n=1 Tax=Glycine max TaxID=3847 RepID=A0A0R0FBR9_SOYBN|nr:hypothetical protein JHK86_050356 [Glycine max]KAG4924660.1 hypothetical protein JHK87_050200 [Glycine soja]KAG5094826.1 hypothetical protein JHK84_050414 [Glycine max]